MSTWWWVGLPAAANVTALCLTVGMSENYLRQEERSRELQQFVRRLALGHVVIVDVVLVALVLLCRDASAMRIVATVAFCLLGSTPAATLTLSDQPPARPGARVGS